MEGVGARLGRSSSRYGTTTVFTGPVRKWKKKWVHLPPPSSANSHRHQAPANGTVNATNGSNLLLYKWTALTPSQNQSNGNADKENGDFKASDKEDSVLPEEPPKRRFKYIPVAVLEEKNNETSEHVDSEAKPIELDTNTEEPASKDDNIDEKPDINDVPMEENEAPENNPHERQDLNESTLDLSLGLNGHDGDDDSNVKTEEIREGRLD